MHICPAKKEVNEKGAITSSGKSRQKTDLIAAEKKARPKRRRRKRNRAAKEAAKVAKAGAASGNAAEGEASRANAKSQVLRKKQAAQNILLDNNSELWQDDSFRIPVLRQEELDPDLCNEPFIQSE